MHPILNFPIQIAVFQPPCKEHFFITDRESCPEVFFIRRFHCILLLILTQLYRMLIEVLSSLHFAFWLGINQQQLRL